MTSEAHPTVSIVSDGPGLKRALGALANGALTFAGVGVFGGLMSLYGFSLNIAGGAMFWGWILTLVTMGSVVLVFAQLASHFPYVGSMYQWPSELASKRVGWSVGWVYAFAMFPLLTAYYASMPVIFKPLFGIDSTAFSTDRNIIWCTAALVLLWNLLDVKLLGRLAEYAMVIEISVVTIVVLVVFLLGPMHFGNLTQMATVTASASGTVSVGSTNFSAWLPLFFGGGIFVSYWVLYTFENGGTLGEETKDASRNAPRGILGAFAFAAGCGILFLVCLTVSLPDIHSSMVNYTPAEDAISLHLPEWVLKVFLFAVVEGLFVATCTMFTGATRHFFGMARDGLLPFSSAWVKTTRSGSPWAACLLLWLGSLVPVIVFTTSTASIVGGATAVMYVAYFLVMVVTLVSRLRGWPRRNAVFDLHGWGLPVNVLAVIGTGFTAGNLLWHRALTNPNYREIKGFTGGSVFSDIPMGWYLVCVPILLGIIYYAFAAKRLGARWEAQSRPEIVEPVES
jgi:amino acid transporter